MWYPRGLGQSLRPCISRVCCCDVDRRTNARSGAASIKLSDPYVPEADADYSVHRRTIAEALMRTAVLVDRAAVEVAHRIGRVPPESVGLWRRRSLELQEMRSDGAISLIMIKICLCHPREVGLGIRFGQCLFRSRMCVSSVGYYESIRSCLHSYFYDPDLTPAREVVTKPNLLDGTLSLRHGIYVPRRWKLSKW